MKTQWNYKGLLMAGLCLLANPWPISAYYAPHLTRWITRDPIGERGGKNLYRLARNETVSHVDAFGLTLYKCSRQAEFPIQGAQHVYLWDDKSGKSCGMAGGALHQHGSSKPGDNGPGTKGHACVPIAGSDGKEAAVMNCCLTKVINKPYLLGGNHCHSFLKSCLQEYNLPDPDIYGLWYGPGDWLEEFCASSQAAYWLCRGLGIPRLLR